LGRKRKSKKSSQQKPPSRDESLVREELGGRIKKKRQQVPRIRENPNWPLTALAGAGMVLTGYLVLTSWLGKHPLYCEGGSTCDIVQQSRWGTFLMLPTAFWGFLSYAALAYIGFRVRSSGRHWKSAWTVSLVGLSYSIYLNAISLFVIEGHFRGGIFPEAFGLAKLQICGLGWRNDRVDNGNRRGNAHAL
jgi:uncharacterized membrane protein